ncbi:Glutathione synthase, substrate-binding, eukaryotic [Corchorus olitorius]|uniref:Glutathione synthase, substrate-binding, eukaryotic n=1 Tax=Corchorus olitorius TaxID=93759 RepID=A0A1R3K941_9ROSI|nr:Glutathione synthase, substrate-binding, eukaryotic [Corchorus olitorius]
MGRQEARSGQVPGVGMVHAPVALLPMPFPESHWKQACGVARISMNYLIVTKKVDAFTSRLLDIHSKMLELNKKEDIRLGLHRSDYMLDEKTKLLLQIEFNTISSSLPGLGRLVTDLHGTLLNDYAEDLGLDSKRIPGNTAVGQFSEALAKAWTEYNNPRYRAVVMVVVQNEERNVYVLQMTVGRDNDNAPSTLLTNRRNAAPYLLPLSPRFIVYNTRGVASVSVREHLEALIQEQKPHVILRNSRKLDYLHIQGNSGHNLS